MALPTFGEFCLPDGTGDTRWYRLPDGTGDSEQDSPNLVVAKDNVSVEAVELVEAKEMNAVELSPIVSNVVILNTAQICACIAMITEDFSIFKGTDHVCFICKKHGLKETKDFEEKSLCEEKMAGINKFYACAKAMNTILHILKEKIGITESEVVQGVILFENVCRSHWNCSSFSLLRCKLRIVFLVCLMISHKLNADVIYQNIAFALIFEMSVLELSRIERIVLSMLDYEFHACFVKQYNKYATMVKASRCECGGDSPSVLLKR